MEKTKPRALHTNIVYHLKLVDRSLICHVWRYLSEIEKAEITFCLWKCVKYVSLCYTYISVGCFFI